MHLTFALDEPIKVAAGPWSHGLSHGISSAWGGAKNLASSVFGNTFERASRQRAMQLEEGGIPTGLSDVASHVGVRKGMGYGSVLGAAMEGVGGKDKDADGNEIPLYERLAKGLVVGGLGGGVVGGIGKAVLNPIASPHAAKVRDYYRAAANQAKENGISGPLVLHGVTKTPSTSHVKYMPMNPQRGHTPELSAELAAPLS